MKLVHVLDNHSQEPPGIVCMRGCKLETGFFIVGASGSRGCPFVMDLPRGERPAAVTTGQDKYKDIG